MLIAEIFNIKLKEDATAGATTSGVVASINMPMFTGKRGGDHYACLLYTSPSPRD